MVSPSNIWAKRVMDIQERSVKDTLGSCSYVTLSYRWPESPKLTLTSTTEARLIASGGLGDHFDDVLPVIKDSMFFLEKLGLKYLWVDAIIPPQEANEDPEGSLAKTEHVKSPQCA